MCGPARDRVLVVALGDREVDTVDDRQLGGAAGHRAGAEERLWAAVVSSRSATPGQRTSGAKLVMATVVQPRARASTERIDDVERLATVADADDEVVGGEHSRGGQGRVPVDRGRSGEPDAAELLLEVDGHEARGADAVELDATSGGHGLA